MSLQAKGDGLWEYAFPTSVTGTASYSNLQLEYGKVLILVGTDVEVNGMKYSNGCLIAVNQFPVNFSHSNGIKYITSREKALSQFKDIYNDMCRNNQARTHIIPLPEWNWYPGGSTPPSNGEYTERDVQYGDCTTGFIEVLSNGSWVRQWDTQCQNPLQWINVSRSTVRIRYKTYGTNKERFTYYAFSNNPNYNDIRANYAYEMGVPMQTVTVRIYSN